MIFKKRILLLKNEISLFQKRIRFLKNGVPVFESSVLSPRSFFDSVIALQNGRPATSE